MFSNLSEVTKLERRWEDTICHPPNSSSLLYFAERTPIFFTSGELQCSSGVIFSWSSSVMMMYFPLPTNWFRHENERQFWPMKQERMSTVGRLESLLLFGKGNFVLSLPLGALVWGCDTWGKQTWREKTKEQTWHENGGVERWRDPAESMNPNTILLRAYET